MTRAAFAYVANTLRPRNVIPGQTYSFQLSVTKTGAAGPIFPTLWAFLTFWP